MEKKNILLEECGKLIEIIPVPGIFMHLNYIY